jgi:integrase
MFLYKQKGRPKYYIRYKNAAGKWVTVPGFTDKAATESKARQLQREAEREQAGLPVVAQAKRQEPIANIIQAFVDELTRLNRSAAHIKTYRQTLERVFPLLAWPNVAAIRVEPFATFLRGLARSPRTMNGYRAALYQLCQFCCSRGWLEENPLRYFKATPLRKVRRRRAYTPEEFRRLCLTNSGELYMVAGLSGFRRGELSRLEKQDLSPYADPPCWHPRKEITKSHRAERIPILANLLPTIRQIWDSLPLPTSRLFPQLPSQRQFDRDLARAGIDRVDDQGRHADFHALRYFFCTQLARVMPIHKVQRMMRHADVRMTSAVYMDLGLTDLWAEAAALPSIDIPLSTPVLTLPEKPAISSANPHVAV